jgi:hypothetical protein
MKAFTGVAPTSRNYLACLFVIGLALDVVPLNAQHFDAQSTAAPSEPVHFRHVVGVVGLGGLKSNSAGTLMFDGGKMTFATGASKAEIPLQLISTFSIARDNVALIRGTPGVIAGMAPYGVGTGP